MSRLLLVEDDANLAAGLLEFLGREGFLVSCAGNLATARAALAREEIDLIILDWMLPDGQGIDLLRELRASRNIVPIIMLTARSDVVDKVIGLEMGASDYMTKPFEPRELVARIRVRLRDDAANAGMRDTARGASFEASGIRMETGTREVHWRGQPVELSRMEFALLQLFVQNPGQVFSREEILNKVWGYERFPTTRTVDTHVLQLRQKFSDELFETIRGVGYRLKDQK